MIVKSNAGKALTHFVQEVGIPDMVVVDNVGEQIGNNTEFVQTCNMSRHNKGRPNHIPQAESS